MSTKRMMCEIVFINGEEEAEAAMDKLQAAGFELMVSNHPDDFDEDSVAKFGMVWKDYNTNMYPHQILHDFKTAVDAVCPNCTDCICPVDPEHVPTRYSDFGFDGPNRYRA